MSRRLLHLATLLLLSCPSMGRSLTNAPPLTVTEQLYRTAADKGGASGQTAEYKCLMDGFSSGPKDWKYTSQWGEDGILEFIFKCLGSVNKTYAEFGVEDGKECATRRLRENFQWTGLVMDGGYNNPSIGLHQEVFYAENIAALLQKYNVPASPDLLVVDADQNTFWIAHALLVAGYKPRVMSVEYNRNFHPTQSYTSLYLPAEAWTYPSCHFGASALAFQRLLNHFDYSIVASDMIGECQPWCFRRQHGAALLACHCPSTLALLSKHLLTSAAAALAIAVQPMPWHLVASSHARSCHSNA